MNRITNLQPWWPTARASILSGESVRSVAARHGCTPNTLSVALRREGLGVVPGGHTHTHPAATAAINYAGVAYTVTAYGPHQAIVTPDPPTRRVRRAIIRAALAEAAPKPARPLRPTPTELALLAYLRGRQSFTTPDPVLTYVSAYPLDDPRVAVAIKAAMEPRK